MAEEPISTLTKNYVSAANRLSSKPTKVTSTASARQSRWMIRLGHLLAGAWVMGAAVLSASGRESVQLMENKALSGFFQLRGPIVPPEDIVILAIDDQSISVPEQYYKTNPKQYAYLETLKSYPYKRAAYAQVITKLIKAGVRSVAADVVFDTPSALRTAQINYPRPKGDRIYFWGTAGTFEQIPFWHGLDPENWNTYLQQGKVLKDKIVLIGATDKLNNDYYPVAVSNSAKPMSGVEIYANAIATLMSGKAIALEINTPPLRGLFVLILVGSTALVISRRKRSINRW
jgi:CHASE2 domain-containing sensor protein